ncbi:MAG: ATP-binding cassette domain-containing protein [Clostridiales bacterium]|nr:ATP-binding cassette domain-containing protein [Clostridiales bacterium]
MIQFRNATLKRKRNVLALKGVSLAVESNALCGVFGRDGAGKTSLFSLIAGYQMPTEGTVSVLGEDPYDNPAVMPKVAFAFVRPESENAVTYKDMMDCCKAFRPRWDESRAKVLADMFQIPMKKPFSSLTRGTVVAAKAALALASNPEVAIYDEICSGLEPDARRLLIGEILDDYKKQPKTVLFSTHYIAEAEKLFKKALILDEGKVSAMGECETLLNSCYIVSGEEKSLKKLLVKSSCDVSGKLVILNGLEDSEIEKAKKLGLEISHPSLEEYVAFKTEKGGEANGG